MTNQRASAQTIRRLFNQLLIEVRDQLPDGLGQMVLLAELGRIEHQIQQTLATERVKG